MNRGLVQNTLLLICLATLSSSGVARMLHAMQATPEEFTERAGMSADATPPASPSPNPSGIPVHWAPTVSTYLFDESLNFAPGFSVNQFDPKLGDLFDPATHESMLCWPTSMANAMAYYKLWNAPPSSNLPLVADPLTGDYTQQVQEFARLCHTDPAQGTNIYDALNCVRFYLGSGGIAAPWAYLIGLYAKDSPPGEPLTNYQKELSLQDIRSALKAGQGVLLEVMWYRYDPAQKLWWTKTGHYVWVVGYDYDASWGDDHMILKIVNPEIDYMSRPDPSNRWDTISILKIPQKSGETYPPETGYLLDGWAFKSVQNSAKAFTRHILTFKPY
jgi:hypothetical protein